MWENFIKKKKKYNIRENVHKILTFQNITSISFMFFISLFFFEFIENWELLPAPIKLQQYMNSFGTKIFFFYKRGHVFQSILNACYCTRFGSSLFCSHCFTIKNKCFKICSVKEEYIEPVCGNIKIL